MNTPLFFRLVRIAVLCAGSAAWFAGCARQNASSTEAANATDYYTCSMHPSVRMPRARDKCPVCGMDLVHVTRSDAASARAETKSAAPVTFVISPEQQRQIGVAFVEARHRPLEASIRIPGTVEAEKQRRWNYTAPAEAWIHALRVFADGDVVEKGQPLIELSCPDFAALQHEFIDALDERDRAEKAGETTARARADKRVSIARERFRTWEIPADQVAALEHSRQPEPYLIVLAQKEGSLGMLAVEPGQHVVAGASLLSVVDLSSVWIWAQVSQEDLAHLAHEAFVRITVPSLPEASFTGKVAIFDHHLDPTTRTARLGIDVENTNAQLHPNFFVDVEMPLQPQIGLAVPADAVLHTGKHDLVFVDHRDGRLEPRQVELGGKYGDLYLVLRGLDEGERVATHANFLIDAEAKIRGVVKAY